MLPRPVDTLDQAIAVTGFNGRVVIGSWLVLAVVVVGAWGGGGAVGAEARSGRAGR
jgi:hypothetical protein